MKVIVTGHKGYIGTVLVPMLLSEGFEVHGIDTDLYKRCTFGTKPIVEVSENLKDIRDVEVDDFVGYDAVIHLAGLSNDPLGDLNPKLTMEINHMGTIRVAEVAKAAGVSRFVFSSSCSMYGASGDKLVDESAQFHPVTPYAVSKVYSERDLLKLSDDSFSPTFLRNATAYGLSPRIRFDLVVNNLTAWAHATKKVRLKSDGSPWRPLVHVQDIAHAFVTVLKAPRDLVHNQAYNVGVQGENYQIREVAEFVRNTVDDSSITFAPDASPDKRCYKVDFQRIHKLLPNYKPQWTVPTGINQLYSAYKNEHVNPEEFEGNRYRRIDHIQYLQQEGFIDLQLRPVSQVQKSVTA